MSLPQFHPKARDEFEKSVLFYDRRFPGLGLAFVIEVEVAVSFALAHPEAGVTIFSEFRRIVVHRFPFSIVYRTKGDIVYIVAVAHQRRHPDYWRERA